MYTSNFGGKKYNQITGELIKNEDKPATVYSSSTIQICPPIFEKLKGMTIKTFMDQGGEPIGARSTSIIVTSQEQRLLDAKMVPMDMFATPDVIFLHELTHAIWGNGTADVGKAYGWRNIRRISMKMGESNLNKATNNADNYAYFCLGAKMINPGPGKWPQRPIGRGLIRALGYARD